MPFDKLVKLERSIERRLDRLTRRRNAAQDPMEWLPPMLEEIGQQVISTGGRGRAFPHAVVLVEVRGQAEQLDALRQTLSRLDLRERVLAKLRQLRCEAPESFDVRLKFVESKAAEGEAPYAIRYKAAPRTRAEAAALAPPVAVQLVVLEGKAERRVHDLDLARINLGRLANVEGKTAQQMRRNHVAFVDEEGSVNGTVSRAHAHIERRGPREFVLFDDGSSRGTSIVRGGAAIPVAARGRRGVRLQHGDELLLGRARVRFLLKEARIGVVAEPATNAAPAAAKPSRLTGGKGRTRGA